MIKIPPAPNVLTVVFHDDGATRYIGTPPTARTVRVRLTSEQSKALRFRGDCESVTIAVIEHDARETSEA